MLDITKKIIIDYIKINEKKFKIKTDFRSGINFLRMIKEPNRFISDFDFFYMKEKPAEQEKETAFKKLLEFYNPKNPLPRSSGKESNTRAFDFEQDADLIFSAFWQVYKIDLLETNLHWHKFLALFNGLTDTKLNQVMAFRLYNQNDKRTYEQAQSELKNAWTLEEETTEQEKENLAKFNAVFS